MLRARNNRLYIVVHDTGYIRNYCPRLLTLLRQFSDRMFIHQTEGEAASAQDSLVLADKLHFVRRPVQAQPRATLRLNDEQDSQGMHLRFSEIWGQFLSRRFRDDQRSLTRRRKPIYFRPWNGSQEPRQTPFNSSRRLTYRKRETHT